MKGSHCLFCYQKLSKDEIDFHPHCSKKIFGKSLPPELPYTEDDMLKLGEQIVKNQKTVTGVQPKLSLGLQKIKGQPTVERFTIVGLWGEHILKPPTPQYPHLPEIEDLTMNLARISKIKTVPHSLIRLKSGQLAYITKRVDREKGNKFHMEDMCQLTERLTEHKYKGSYERIAKAILKYSTNPGFDVITFYEQVLFSFLTGNNDMHLKNFSLLKDKDLTYNLCPAYDLVASELLIEDDDEELALNLNGKKKKLKRQDFEIAMKKSEIPEKAIENIFKQFEKTIPKWKNFIEISFISNEMKEKYHQMIKAKQLQIGLGI